MLCRCYLATLSWRTLFAISVIEVDTLSISGQIEP